MADEAPDTFGGGVRSFLATIGFVLPLVGVEQLIQIWVHPPALPWWASLFLIVAGLPVYLAPATWKYLKRNHTADLSHSLGGFYSTTSPNSLNQHPAIPTTINQKTNSQPSLRDILLTSYWMMNFNPHHPDGRKRISFLPDGLVGKGRNVNEHRWELSDDLLRIYRADGSLQNDFRCRKSDGWFIYVRNDAALGNNDQIIYKMASENGDEADSQIPIQDAAQIAYERAEIEGWLDSIVGETTTPQLRLEYFKHAMLVQAAHYTITLNGVRLPSRQSFPIQANRIAGLHPIQGQNTVKYLSGTQVSYDNVTISRSDLEKVIGIYHALATQLGSSGDLV